MDNRKRQRLDLPRSANTIITVNNTTTTLNNTTAQPQQPQHVSTSLLANANTLFLDNTLPANVFLTICDEDGISDDEAHEYYAIDSETLAAHIKQEQHDISTQTLPPLQQIRLISTQPPLPQQQQQLTPQTRALLTNTTTNETPNLQLAASPAANALLSASMQLPSGCEIYLVKEYIDDIDNNDAANLDLTDMELLQTNKSLKLETESLVTHNSAAGDSTLKEQKAILPSNAALQCDTIVPADQELNTSTNTLATPEPTPPKTTNSATSTNAPTNTMNNKRQSIILDAYKKRDDKRRATHNEVERRRRDKINSWIFKLKEMLPTDMPNISNNNNNTNNCNNSNSSAINSGTANSTAPNTNTNTTTGAAVSSNNSTPHLITINGHNSNRTPPSDSKSQILIKACEYIKIMQQEINSIQ